MDPELAALMKERRSHRRKTSSQEEQQDGGVEATGAAETTTPSKSRESSSSSSRPRRHQSSGTMRDHRRRRERPERGSGDSGGGDDNKTTASSGSGEQQQRSSSRPRRHRSSGAISTSGARDRASDRARKHRSTTTGGGTRSGGSSSRRSASKSQNSSSGSLSKDDDDDDDDDSDQDEEEDDDNNNNNNNDDFASAFGSNSNTNSHSAFGGADPFASMDFGGTTQTTTPTMTNATAESNFGSFPTDFGSGGGGGASTFFTEDPHMINTQTTAEEDDGYEPPSFASSFASGGSSGFPALAKIYDKTPIDHPPTTRSLVGTLSLSQDEMNNKATLLLQSPMLIPSPVANPLTGNLILCRRQQNTDDSNWALVEWNPHTRTQVRSMPIMTTDLRQKVAQKYKVSAAHVDTVLTLAVGLHQTSPSNYSQTRARVACLMDLTVLENSEVLRVLAIFQWGYASATTRATTSNDDDGEEGGAGGGDSDKPEGPVTTTAAAISHSHGTIQLESLLSPPSGSDFSYNTDSLLVADSCVFISGASTKGPCIFLCKPTVRETWSANFVGKDAARVANMAVTTHANTITNIYQQPLSTDKNSTVSKRDLGKQNVMTGTTSKTSAGRLPYLAIALTDGSLSVWSYEAATKVSSKTTEAIKRLLYPLCRLDTKTFLKAAGPVLSLDRNNNNSDGNAEGFQSADAREVGYCTHLEWVPPRASAFGQLMLLAASYQGGLVLYHVALPMMQKENSSSGKKSYAPLKPPTDKTQLSQTCSIPPLAMAKYPTVHHRAFVSFCDVGPHIPPTVAVLLTGLQTNVDYALMALVTCQLPTTTKSSESLAKLHVWDSREWKAGSGSPRGLIP